ncbi:MAG: SBBP repeat-containing protein [Saprospiraceae bacterium]|nr:SBBP repeat-containing protein [Saprospiraceae bacterium]
MQFKFTTLVFAFCMGLEFIASQTVKPSWAFGIGDTGPDAGNSLHIDPDGNLLITGFFRGNPDFDPGPGEFKLLSNGSEDVFVCKYDPSGHLIWAKNFGSRREDRGQQITTDTDGNIYISGYFRDAVSFDEENPDQKFFPKGFSDGFVLKLDKDGTFVWVKQIAGNLDDIPKCIAVDRENEILVAGYFQGTTDFDPSEDTLIFQSKGVNDVFILKLNQDGDLRWAKHLGGRFDDQASAVLIHPNNEITVTGNFLDSLDIDPGVGTYWLTSKASGDVFILRLDSEANFKWAGQFRSDRVVNNIGAYIDRQGFIYMTGFFDAQTDFNPGSDSLILDAPNTVGDIFVVKLDELGNLQWARKLGGDAHDVGLGITTDELGNVYTTGCYQMEADFDPGPGEVLMRSEGNHNNDIFVSKLNSNGEFVGCNSVNGPMNDIGFSLAANKQNQLFVTGIFTAKVTYNQIPDTTLLQSHGAEDLLLLRYDFDISQTINASLKSDWSIFPTLVDHTIHITCKECQSTPIEYKIFDLKGNLLLTRSISEKTELVAIPVLHLPSSFYILQLRDESETIGSFFYKR